VSDVDSDARLAELLTPVASELAEASGFSEDECVDFLQIATDLQMQMVESLTATGLSPERAAWTLAAVANAVRQTVEDAANV
jgi:Glu-tRNA(Gln) amidotransferase subunit E-like FAD-binding protein